MMPSLSSTAGWAKYRFSCVAPARGPTGCEKNTSATKPRKNPRDSFFEAARSRQHGLLAWLILRFYSFADLIDNWTSFLHNSKIVPIATCCRPAAQQKSRKRNAQLLKPLALKL